MLIMKTLLDIYNDIFLLVQDVDYALISGCLS